MEKKYQQGRNATEEVRSVEEVTGLAGRSLSREKEPMGSPVPGGSKGKRQNTKREKREKG